MLSPDDRIIYLLDRDVVEAAAASDIIRQRRFGELFSLIDSTVVIPEAFAAFPEDSAKILADAANHIYMSGFISETCDGYFTLEEIDRASFQASRREAVAMCSCSAHQLLTEASASRQRKMTLGFSSDHDCPLQMMEESYPGGIHGKQMSNQPTSTN